jgi:cysteine-rich repeat protein
LLFRVLENTTCSCNVTNYKEDASVYPACKIINSAWCQPYEYWNTTLGACKEICGDGKVYVLECDDGNLLNGDGCSSSCTIEPNFICVNGSTTRRSVCSYTAPLELKLTETSKKPNSNTVVFKLAVQPPLTSLSGLPSFKNIISTNLKNSGVDVTYENGSLTITVNYSENIQGKACSIQFAPPNSSSALFAVPESQIIFDVLPENNEAALYFNESTYILKNTTDTTMTVAQGMGLSSMGAGLIVTKSLSLELTSVLQVGFLSLSTVDNLNPILSSLYNLKYMNGYNNMMKEVGL